MKTMKNDTMCFYMWRHPYTGMTCYGITGDTNNRKRTYQGGNGFDIIWAYLVCGDSKEIKKLEKTLKQKIKEIETNTNAKLSYGDYEWIVADVEFDSIVQLVESFIAEDNYKTLEVILKENS